MLLTDSARILYGSPLSRPKNTIFAIIVLVMLLLASTFSHFRNFSTLSPGAVQVYIIGLLASLLMALIPLAILWFLDRREPESRWLYLIAVLWGAIIASAWRFPLTR
ncbi:hypothetical protein ACQ4M4_14560 [Leptolyngbya sp. AN02str]|uniref:hypothetical protein n=1 Tax=Leptolyngbya sp. AN02str TaxID=3423363 RepID=UPI003D31BF3F